MRPPRLLVKTTQADFQTVAWSGCRYRSLREIPTRCDRCGAPWRLGEFGAECLLCGHVAFAEEAMARRPPERWTNHRAAS